MKPQMRSNSVIRRMAHQDPAKAAAEIISLRSHLAEAEANLEKIGYLKMDTEIAELQHKLKEAEETIRKLGEESLRDQEKLRKAEEQVARWLKQAGDLQATLASVEKELSQFVKLADNLTKKIGGTKHPVHPDWESEFTELDVAIGEYRERRKGE